MTLQRQARFWLVSLLLFVAALWLLQEILLPFIAGFVLAYFLDPVADRLEKLGLPRVVATLLILIVAISAVVVAVLVVAPILATQAVKLANDLPTLVKALVARLDEVTPDALKSVLASAGGQGASSVGDVVSKAAGWLVTVLQSVWSGGMALVNLLSLLVVTPIVAFYLLLDWDHLVAKIDSWIPRPYVEEVRSIARDIDRAMAGFIRGQGTVCLLLGIFYAIGLSVAGLNFGLAIGFGAGILSFIPYVGAIIGGVLAIGVALVQFWPDYTMILVVIGIFRSRTIHRGQLPVAQAGRKFHRPASGLADVCPLCLWLSFRFCRPAAGGAAGGGCRGLRTLWPCAISALTIVHRRDDGERGGS